MKSMKCSASVSRTVFLLVLLFCAISMLQGCFSYTSSFIEDPTSRKVSKGVDPAAEMTKQPAILIENTPSTENPTAPIILQAVERRTGPEAETLTVNEYKYKRQWSPLLIPVGLFQLVVTPFICLGAGLDQNPDSKALDTLFAGMNDRGCETKGFARMGTYFVLGIHPTCEVRESSTKKEKKLTGRTISEDKPYQNAELRMVVSPLFSSESVPAKASEKTDYSFKLDGNGRAVLDPVPLFKEFPKAPREVSIAFGFADSPQPLEKVVIDEALSAALYLPVRETKAAEQAEREGQQAAALEHYGKAYAAVVNKEHKQTLWKKIAALYRSLPTKPVVPDDARRFMARGQAALENAKSPQDFDAVIREFEQAALIAPAWPDIYYNLGVLHGKSGRYDDAIANFQKYLDLAPTASDAEQVKNLIYQFEYKKENAGGGKGTGGTGRKNQGR